MDTRAYSRNQEEQVAGIVGGRVVANSGATKAFKGDVRTDTFLIECKTVTKKQETFSVKKSWLDGIKKEAFEERKSNSAVAIQFEPGGKNYFVIDSNLMALLIEFLEG